MMNAARSPLFTNVSEKAGDLLSGCQLDLQDSAVLSDQHIDDIICKQLQLNLPPADLAMWDKIVDAPGQP